MKKIYLILFAFALTAVSCERVVVIDLNEASPKLVVEGRIVLDSVAVVVLRETGSYFVPDSQPGVTDAQVILHDDAGHFDTLQHDQNGVYKGSTLLGEEETTYYLDILHDDIIYESESYLDKKPIIYSLTQRSFESFGNFGDDSSGFDFGGGDDNNGLLDSLPWFLFTNIFEDTTRNNQYLIRYCVNGKTESGRYNVTDDTDLSGDTLSYSPGPTALFYSGDTVGVRVYAIDGSVYRFFNSLNDALSSNPFFSSTPYNPVSNISDGALGYFAAMSFSCDTTIITTPELSFP